MDAEFVEDIQVFLNYIGWGVRFLGMLVFGLMSGWLTMRTFSQAAKAWQVQAAAVIALLYLATIMVNSTHPGAAGAYTLGAGVGLFIWGLNKEKGSKPAKK